MLLFALLFALPLAYWFGAADLFGAPKVTLLRLGTLALVALLIAGWMLTGRLSVPKSRAVWAAAGFILLVGLSTLFSQHLPTSFLGLAKRFFGLATYVPFFVLLWAAASTNWSERRLRVLFMAVLASAVISSLLAILQAAGLHYPLDLSNLFPGRGYALVGNPNFLGIFLSMNVPLALALAHRGKGLEVAAAVACLALIVAGIASTLSLGAFGALAIAVYVFYLLRLRGTPGGRFLLLGGAGVLALVGLMMIALFHRSESESIAGRLQTWQAVGGIAAAYPLLGSGPDTVRLVVGEYLPPVKGHHQDIPEDGHNLFLTMAATLGLPALAVFLVFLVLIAREGLRAPPGPLAWARAPLLALGAAYVVGQMVNPDDLAPATLFWAMAGVVVGLGSPSRLFGKPAPAGQSGGTMLLIRGSAGGLILVACLLLGILAVRPLLAEVYLYRADSTEDIVLANALFSQATRANPLYDRYPLRHAERLYSYIQRDNDWIAGGAVLAAKEAVARSPLEADDYTVLGSVYRALGETSGKPEYFREAERHYQTALSHSPYQLFALRGLALTYKHMGKPAQGARYTARYLAVADSSEIAQLHRELLKAAQTP